MGKIQSFKRYGDLIILIKQSNICTLLKFLTFVFVLCLNIFPIAFWSKIWSCLWLLNSRKKFRYNDNKIAFSYNRMCCGGTEEFSVVIPCCPLDFKPSKYVNCEKLICKVWHLNIWFLNFFSVYRTHFMWKKFVMLDIEIIY